MTTKKYARFAGQCLSVIEKDDERLYIGQMTRFNAARIVGELQAATGLNECTSEGSGWRRMPEPRKAWLLRSNKPPA